MTSKALVISLIISILAVCSAHAGGLRFTYGVDWGATVQFFRADRMAFYTEEQFLVQTRQSRTLYHTNGHCLLTAGVDIGEKFSLSACTGYQGLASGKRGYPIALQGRFFPRSSARSGLVLGADGGILLDEKFSGRPGWTGRVSAGWRLPLGSRLKMDVQAGWQVSLIHPQQFTDPISGGFVTGDRVRFADSWLQGVFVGLSLHL